MLAVGTAIWLLNRRDARQPAPDSVAPVFIKATPAPRQGTALRVAAIVACTLAVTLLFFAIAPAAVGWKPLVITSGSMEPTIHPGDIVVINPRVKPSAIKINQLVTYRQAGTGHYVTHRVIAEDNGLFLFKGDANEGADTTPVSPQQIVGQARIVVPFLGKVTLAFKHHDVPFIAIVVVGAIVVLNVLMPKRATRKAAALAATVTIAAGTMTSAAAFSATTNNTGNTVATSSFYSANVIAGAPVSYWRLGESSGTNAVDAMGYQNGTYTNSPTLSATGAIAHDTNTCINLTGTSYVTVPTKANLNIAGNMTVETWFKPTAVQSANARVITKYDSSAASINYMLAYDSTKTYIRFLMDNTSSTRYTALGTTAITDTTKWYFLVGVYDGTNLRIYVNGTQDASVPATGTPKTVTSPVGLGAEGNGTTKATGYLDDVAIYSRALSPTEISNQYALATT